MLFPSYILSLGHKLLHGTHKSERKRGNYSYFYDIIERSCMQEVFKSLIFLIILIAYPEVYTYILLLD